MYFDNFCVHASSDLVTVAEGERERGGRKEGQEGGKRGRE